METLLQKKKKTLKVCPVKMFNKDVLLETERKDNFIETNRTTHDPILRFSKRRRKD